MVVRMELKHVDTLKNGRKRFRRRFPKALREAVGQEWFQRTLKAQEGAALAAEHAALSVEYARLVQRAERAAEDGLSPREEWQAKLVEAERLLASVQGHLNEDDKRDVLADDIAQRTGDKVLYRAVVDPTAEVPPVTMLDAKRMYTEERLSGGSDDRSQRARLDRVCKRLEVTLGPLKGLPLIDLRREHARKLRDAMLSTKVKGGKGTLSLGTVKREWNTVRAMVTLAIREFDLEGTAHNPFAGLSIENRNAAPEDEASKRLPLPEGVVTDVRARVEGHATIPELALIWRILEGTGCRLAEVVGLRVEDVHLSAPVPFIRVVWHADRRVKTKASLRSVPLIGDAFEAAAEAVGRSGGAVALFPRYAGGRGADTVSASLMKHLRKVTSDKRHTVHSLRHGMKDKLRGAGVAKDVADLILGHAVRDIGDRVYGGDDAKLAVAADAMKRALGLPSIWCEGP